MKNLLIIFILALTSCGLLRKKGEGHGTENGQGASKKDSITVNLSDSVITDIATADDILTKSKHIVLTSNGDLLFPTTNLRNNLKIVEINNTKVISKLVSMSDGRVVYSIPERMKIRSTYQVLLRISQSKATLSIYDNLEGTVRTSEIPVTQTMQVCLVDPSPFEVKSFDIVADNNAVQIIDGGDTYTQWTWNVTPVRLGNYNLKIVVSIIRDGNRKDVVYQDVVQIEKDISAQTSFFWNKYWQWIIATFILPFIIFLYKKRKEKNDGKNSGKVS